MRKKLSDKREAFCIEYLVDLNATQAAIRAGYSKKTANRIASQLLTKLDIQERVAELKQERCQRTKIDADWVLLSAKRVFDRCMQDEQVVDREGWPVLCNTSDGEVAAAYKFDASGANKALETIGKHVDVNAFGTVKQAADEQEEAVPVKVVIEVEDARKDAESE